MGNNERMHWEKENTMVDTHRALDTNQAPCTAKGSVQPDTTQTAARVPFTKPATVVPTHDPQPFSFLPQTRNGAQVHPAPRRTR